MQKIFTLFLFVFSIGLLAPTTELAQAEEEHQQTKSKTTILSASEYDYPPFCLMTDEGEATGFSVELLQAALETMGHGVAFNVGPWAEVKQLLINRKVQVMKWLHYPGHTNSGKMPDYGGVSNEFKLFATI